MGFFADSNPFGLSFDAGKIANNTLHQVNMIDTLSWIVGTHQLRVGLDYRRLHPEEGSLSYQLGYQFLSLANVLSDSLPLAFVASRTADVQLVISNWSIFAQDSWNAAPNLTVTYGLQWDYNSAPSSPNGTPAFTVNQVDDFATMTVAAAGTPLWRTQKDKLSGAKSVQRPNVVPGVPSYLDLSSAPGGKVINPAAFSIPAAGQGDLGRNALRGFSAAQWDLTVRRQFRVTSGFSFQTRVDFFNVLNHPNFGSPVNYLSSPQFGQPTQMLSNSLGAGGQSGGLSSLYQIGGPRSIQLALKLQF